MSLSAASTFARRGRHSKFLAPVALSAFANGPTPRHRGQQTRSYRFGRLSSYLDPYFRHDAYTRHQPHGYNKYCENLYQRSSYDKHTLAEDVKSSLKRVVDNYWSPDRRTGQGAGRYVDMDASPRQTPENPEGIRPGQNIEDAERSPLEHFLFGDQPCQRAQRYNRSATGRRRVASAPRAGSGADVTIDPITNRRVPKKSSETNLTSDQGVDMPVKTSGPYKSQFEPLRAPKLEDAQAPIFYDGPPPEAELRMYGREELWDPITPSDPAASQTPKKEPSIHHHTGLGSRLMGALGEEHKEVQWHQTGNIASTSATPPGTREYTDLHKYSAVQYQEPDGKPADEHSIEQHDDLAKYGAVRAHEPDGRYKLESESAVDPQELNSYEAVRSQEPDGKYAAEYTEAPDDAELTAYRKPFLADEPDGKYAANHTEPECDAAELSKYRQPFFSYEPDGKYAASQAELQRDEAELSQYKAFRSHEPNGKYAANPVEEKSESDELSTYGAFRSHEPDGKYAANPIEEKPGSDELGTYGAFRSHEPDGKYALRDEPPTEPADTQKYEAVRSHEPDGKYAAEAEAAAAKESEDLANHEAFGYEDAETRPLPQEAQSSKNAADLEGYRTSPYESLDSPASTSTYEDYDPAELRKYQAVRWNEPDGKPTAPEAAHQTPLDYDLAGETHNQEKTTYRKKVEQLMAQAAAESDISTAPVPSTSPNHLTETVSHPTSPPPPTTLYKILVYDPTTTTLSTADTTSPTPPFPSTSPTPAEILPKLTHPAKFLPHLAPLQAQGFALVAGSDNMLVFSKTQTAGTAEGRKPVNPIDRTGDGADEGYTVAAGRFASPTGFVNYDLPPVVGGAEGGRGVKGKRGRRVVKRMVVGGAVVAGGVYGLGVVGEALKRGGAGGAGGAWGGVASPGSVGAASGGDKRR